MPFLRFIKRWLPTGEEVNNPGRFMRQSVAMLRREYKGNPLIEEKMEINPIDQFEIWFQEALVAVKDDPNAMLLSTVGNSGQPSCRTVLLKEYDKNGFVFYTNYESRKSKELENNPQAALTFYWPDLMRQIRIEGQAEKVSGETSDYYFSKRPEASKLSAWASPQSVVVSSREELEKKFREQEQLFHGKTITRPPDWGGYLVKPHRFEFWQGRVNRLHDRICYKLDKTKNWTIFRLAP